MKKIFFYVILFSIINLFCDGIIPLGDGTETSPYLISSQENLEYVSANEELWEDKYFLQTQDIDWTSQEDFIPWGSIDYIPHFVDGTFEGYIEDIQPFNSNYDGNNFSINNLLIDYQYHLAVVGFIAVKGNGVIKNVNLNGLYVYGKEYSGGLIGMAFGLIENGYIENCHVNGSVSAPHSGLLIGQVKDNPFNPIDPVTLLIDNCSANGIVEGSGPKGGLIGGGRNYILRNSTMTGEVNLQAHMNTGYGDDCGGLIGRISYHNAWEGFPSYHYSNIYGPFVVDNSYYKYSDISFNGVNMYTLGCLPDDLYEEWVANDYQLDIEDYLVSEDDTYLISSLDDFKAFSAFAHQGLNFRLETDIDLQSEPNFTIPYFNGNFDGQNFVIRNLNLNIFNSNVGLFGVLESATISNLIIENAEVVGQDFTGILAGFSTGDIINCHVNGNVSGTNCIGLLNGYQSGKSTVSKCSANGLIENGQYAGGLIGFAMGNSEISNYCVISDCYSRGNGVSYVGGISSDIKFTKVENCYSTLTSDSDNSSNALFWVVYDADINNCFWSEEVSGMTDEEGTGISEEAMHSISTFTDAGWDFNEIWAINQNINDGFPYLQNQFPVPNNDEDLPVIALNNSIKSTYPNPFNPETTIEFNVKSQGKAHLSVYNIKGQLVKSFGEYRSGDHKVTWKGNDNHNNKVSSGLYLIRLNSDNDNDVRKVMLMK